MHQGKSLTFIAHPRSSRSDDTHDAPAAVVRVLIYLQGKLNICLRLICDCLHLHMMYVAELMPTALQRYGEEYLSNMLSRRRMMMMMKNRILNNFDNVYLGGIEAKFALKLWRLFSPPL